MTDETEIIAKEGEVSKREDHGGTSHVFQISVRAWLAIMLLIGVCLHGVGQLIVAVHLAWTNPATPIEMVKDLLKVGEPLYTMAGMALAYYFGQQKIKQ